MESRTCHSFWCNYTTTEPLTKCPKCGQRLLTADSFRLLGLLLIFLGAILALAGGLLLIFLMPILLGGIGIKIFVGAVFSFLLASGLAMMAAGFWQGAFGKRSQSLIKILIVLLVALFAIAAIGRALLL